MDKNLKNTIRLVKKLQRKDLLYMNDDVELSVEPNYQVLALIIEDVDLTNPMVILIGNETYGLSNNYKQICDTLARIPMYGKITSFNVSCAASIMLYEIDRQRRKVII